MLCIAYFVPVSRWAPRYQRATSTANRLTMPWALQLIYVQIALVYFETVVTARCDSANGFHDEMYHAEPAMRAFIEQFEQSILQAGGGYRCQPARRRWRVFRSHRILDTQTQGLIGLFIVPCFTSAWSSWASKSPFSYYISRSI